MMILSLHSPPPPPPPDNDLDSNKALLIRLVGGKAASLMKLYATPAGCLSSFVPQGFCLTVEFFAPWMNQVMAIPEWRQLQLLLSQQQPHSDNTAAAAATELIMHQCSVIEAVARNLALNEEQSATLIKFKQDMMQWTTSPGAVAVRSSAPEEDGSLASFAGVFETKLGVAIDDLESAIRHCFASRFDYRVFQYTKNSMMAMMKPSPAANTTTTTTATTPSTNMGFAVIVMEMVDSCIAGVAFSANPLNSDLDELVVDSAYGLGEVVVDGTVEADHYVYDKVAKKIVEKKIGSKQQEKRLVIRQQQHYDDDDDEEGGDGNQKVIVSIEIKDVDKARQTQSSLRDEQLDELARLVCLVEATYQQPVDVEWAFARNNNNSNNNPESSSLQLKLLQARPITTNFQLDECMLTKPGERRILYYDFNIASEATTMTPFTHMDMKLYSKFFNIFLGVPTQYDLMKSDPRLPVFNASTRQYCNFSLFLRFLSPKYCSDNAKILDPYLSNLFASSDCNRERYRTRRKDWPSKQGVNLCNTFWLLRQFPIMKSHKIARKFEKNPEVSKKEYLQLLQENLVSLQELGRRGMQRDEEGSGGLAKYIQELYDTIMPSLEIESFVVMRLLIALFSDLDAKRREGKTVEERNDYDALCGGYEGDELMEMNKEIYRLARKLPMSIWQQYEYSTFDKLAERIQANLNGSTANKDDMNDNEDDEEDLPKDFLLDWARFMDKHGYDGQDQLFVSSARYIDNPAILLAKLRHNIGDGILDPAVAHQHNLDKRRKVMERHETEARNNKRCGGYFLLRRSKQLSSIQRRNALLDHAMWLRNSPKIHVARVTGMIRQEILKVEKEFIASGRLEQEGDIFHLDVGEVDTAIMSSSSSSSSKNNNNKLDLMEIVRPRKAIYERAVRSKQCPMLVDSRCRILKPDVKDEQEPGTYIGAPVGAPGVVASARVRIVHHPTDPLESGEVLVATVTDPAWTPMFAGASAIILQIGGALQHGALCAREYGKPAVSGIDDVMKHFKTGMMVSVDGNTGIVKILKDPAAATAADQKDHE